MLFLAQLRDVEPVLETLQLFCFCSIDESRLSDNIHIAVQSRGETNLATAHASIMQY